ncbi:DNA/RNA non-specific endonuclease [Amycolatopsis sp. OK19-0408]|uniref:DNA/RNA non-specific endonuclease n=1 Tax=Amycolatopsis iheyensis TaxID=2945988 RepID=A0A9X2SNJ2_9PSEU|nr:DNA/RNA non-specific endonuclease [Amycolatopsis iheyensis]MCR6489067.1 DNA/RNA non-specific endonuclease [Amycolatopsis iheyensis]
MDVRTERPSELQDAVAARAARRGDQRRAKIALLGRPGGIAQADEPSRVATRIDRLGRYYPDVRPVSPAAIAAGEPAAMTAAGAILERIILTDDLLGVGYLEGGVTAAAAVGRVNIRDERGRLVGYGTGSLVSPELLLTNHHVLPDAATAGFSVIEFDYQDGVDGLPLPVRAFGLDPDRFFVADEGLDFALVAVKAADGELGPFGFNRLIGTEGKAIVGDFVTIVQHPQGGKKQVALRENRVVDVLDDFLHYETDTEPGSSGSPVFNDQWEVVALHHASVRADGHAEFGNFLNEGIRVSKLLKFLAEKPFPADRQALLDRLSTRPERASRTPVPDGAPQVLTLTMPVDIRLRAEPAAAEETGRIDPDYSNREGYDPGFLPGHTVGLPTLPDALLPLAAINRQATTEPRYVLPYHHFSVVMHKERALAFFTAVNIDGRTSQALRREADHWSLDPRVAESEQLGEEIYRANPLDRGHLVRRLDPAWGATAAIAQLGNDDTFHFTNCSPQHKDFNQNKTTWAGLEDYVLNNAANHELKVSVVTGPVLAEDDDQYRGARLPRQFWKVVAMVKADGTLSATAYLLSQESLIKGLEVAAEFSYGAYRTYQVPVRRIETLTGLSFGTLPDADPLTGLESTTEATEIRGAADLVL